MQDTEFTVEEGRLYMLQTRNAKRPAQAAVRFAVDAVDEGLLTKSAGDRDDRRLLTRRAAAPDLRPRRSPTRSSRPASPPHRARPRARSFHRPAAVAAAEAGEHVVLVRPFTEAEDVAGFFAAQGILTSEGGKASHAALVARGMGRPCVCGASGLDDRPRGRRPSGSASRCSARRQIAINGSTARSRSTMSRSSTPTVTRTSRPC